ncbi:hypothetical protein ACSQ67_010112 [Phaseolus vulgaris]
MASSVMASVALKPAPFTVEKSSVRGLPSLSRNSSSFRVVASGGKKIKTDTPYGISGGMNLRDGVDASGRKGKEKPLTLLQHAHDFPIYDTKDWSPTGDVYAGGTTGLAIWAVTLLGLLAGGALLVYNTSALAQ